jgi:hypothetical protein
MNAEFEGLLGKQEEFKAANDIAPPTAELAYGGQPPVEFAEGGFGLQRSELGNYQNPQEDYFTDSYQGLPQNYGQNNFEVNPYVTRQEPSNQYANPIESGQPDYRTDDRFIPGLSPAANITNVLGNAVDYGIAKRNKPNKLNLGRIGAEKISLARSREAARTRGETSRNIGIRNIRDLSRSGSQALSNLGAASTGADRVAGEQIGKSFEQEALTNAKLRQRSNEQNARLAASEAQYNTTQDNAYQERLGKLDPFRSVLKQAGQYSSDVNKNRQFYESAYFQNPNLRGKEDPNVTPFQRFLGNRGTKFNVRD